MKDKDIKFILISFMALAAVAFCCLLLLSSCEKESNTTTLKVEVTPIENREHVVPVCIVHFNDVRDTFQYIMIEEFNFEFEYVIPSKSYYFEYTLDTNHNVKEFRLYENDRLIKTVKKQGEKILINKL